MIDPNDTPSYVVYIFELANDSRKEIGEVACTARGLSALRYALKHVEYIGIEAVPMEPEVHDHTH